MRLVSLELNGFKSFADPQRLTFPGGLTAVVGPNGCGKSNIADGLSWVLGEQRVTLLRGHEMADVIFAGTTDRRAMGFAEVKLNLEMPDPALPGAVKEVVVSRRLYRDQGGEYRINGKECRLKDIHDLLMDTGMGTRAYSFIQQGQIDQILSSKPRDRRVLLEEAAGITRYKARRAEAEKRLEDTRANLLRLDDILAELEKQLESLRRQASRARRAQELDAEIKAAQRILLSHKAGELQASRERIALQLDGSERQIASLTAQVSERASEVELARLVVDERAGALDRLARAVLALDQRVSLAEQDIRFQKERAEEAAQAMERLGEREGELRARSLASQEEIRALQGREAEGSARLALEEAALAAAGEAVALAAGLGRKLEGELRELRQKREERRKAQGLAHRQRHAILSQIAQLEGRLDAHNHEESLRAPRLEGLKADQERLGRSLEGATLTQERAEEAALVQGRLAREAEEALRSLQEARSARALRLDALERQARQIEDHLRRASGEEEQAQALRWLRERGSDPRPLAEVLDVEEAWRSDLERLLGAWLASTTLANGLPEDLAGAPGHLQLALEGVGLPTTPPPDCEALAGHITWRGPRRPFQDLLNRAWRCSDAALPGLSRAHPDQAFVSPGLVRLPFGPVQVGLPAPAESPLKLRAELERTVAERGQEAGLQEAAELELSAAQGALGEARERLEVVEDERREARRLLEELGGQKASVDAQLAEIEEITRRADELWEGIEKETERLRAELRALEEHPEQQEDLALEGEIHSAEERFREQHAALDALRETQLAAARSRDAAWAERDGAARHLAMLQRGAHEIGEELERLGRERSEAGERGDVARRRGAELEDEVQALLVDRGARAAEQSALSPLFEEEKERLRGLERDARALQEALENARGLHQELLLQDAQVHGSIEAVGKEIELALGMEVPEFLASVGPEEREAWDQGELVHQTRLAELQGKRLDLGSVNQLAIQDLAEAEDRLDFMTRQREDVQQAIQNLEATIREINATSEERFKEAFDFINARFQEVFREAFEGGSAHLALEDPRDLLECGIEITAQPPGKTAKALTLLSGGEKALTAISLLFAIFQFKPSPFCVLDEVDAPLDDANVSRFAAMVGRMKADTQFIVITHQKPTMVAADTLYGVTMQERGVSRLVSVQLREAEQLV
ncbi:MAG: AAA family ATPase [Acidobacteria bacterium]|nr:AAA family ATPase [Acidobacteriota bacterium]